MTSYFYFPPRVIIPLLFLVLIFGHEAVFAQSDDPNLDQVPSSLINYRPSGMNVPVSSTVTIGNWDNFNLGVDFGESNMAMHPFQPGWFFTAYNVENPHHTENGIDWETDHPVFGMNMRGDPVCTYDSLGNLYYQNMYGADIQGALVVRSIDNGASWFPPVIAVSGNDKCWIACDQTSGPFANYVYATMTNNGTGAFTRSIDYGATFENTFSPSTQELPGMMVCVGPLGNVQGGAVYVVTNSGDPFASTYSFYMSQDGGLNFQLMSAQNFAGYVGSNLNGRHSVENMRTRPYPYITADNSYGPHRGRLYLIYASNDPPGDGNKPDIWCRYSDNSGITWSNAARVNDDPNPAQHHQWHPATWCDKETGRLYIQWMDTRDTPTSDSALIYATYSDDGGNTFVTNQQISNQKMVINCTTCPGGGTPRYQGDYNGIISSKYGAVAGWTDFRNGNFMSTTAYFPDYAMTLRPAAATLMRALDSTEFHVSVPGVKLYSDTVFLSAEVDPQPAVGSLTFSFPEGNYMTTFPDSLSVRVVLQGAVPVGEYALNFITRGPGGTPAHKRTALLLVSGYPGTADADPDSICAGQTSQLTSSMNGGTPPYSYTWSPVTGLSDPTIQNPVASPMTTTNYHVQIVDAQSHMAEDSAVVTVLTPPQNPAPILGSPGACENSYAGYSIPAIAGATTYSWTVPEGATITEGQNTPAIMVLWGTQPGPVSVIAGNSCGTTIPSVLTVDLASPVATPGAIEGADLGCVSGLVELHVEEVTGATGYTWTVPPDATIALGQGTSSVAVVWGSNPGMVTVAAFNACGSSSASQKYLAVDSVPSAAGFILGKDTVCVNHAGYTYSIEPIANAQVYVWSVPEGATLSGGEQTNSVIIDFGQDAVSGEITVFGSNTCGLGGSATKNIIVSQCPGVPENTLESEVTLYPNPAGSQLNIRIRGNELSANLFITDILGHPVRSMRLENLGRDYTLSLDLSDLVNGLYSLKLVNEGRVYNGKFIIRKEK